MQILPGVPNSFVDELQRRSGLRDMPAVEAGTAPEEAADLFRQKGIVAIRGALPDDVLTRLRAKCATVMGDIVRKDPQGLGSRGPKRYSFGGSSSTGSQLHHPEWAALVDVPAVTAVLDVIWPSQDYACHTAGGDFCLSGAPGHQNLHADAWFPGCEELEHAPRIAVNYLVEDQTPFNGPLRIIPGTHRACSHEAPEVQDEPEDFLLSTTCPLPAGTALIRDLRTWHGGTPNLSTSHRPMPNAEFTAPYMLEFMDPNKLPKAMPHDIWEGLSERGRQLARYIKAPLGEPVRAVVKFDISPGGDPGTRAFFNGFELAPLFAVCKDAVEQSGKTDGSCIVL